MSIAYQAEPSCLSKLLIPTSQANPDSFAINMIKPKSPETCLALEHWAGPETLEVGVVGGDGDCLVAFLGVCDTASWNGRLALMSSLQAGSVGVALEPTRPCHNNNLIWD